MRDYNLGFISNEDIYRYVKATVESFRMDITLASFNENIIDPIKLTFDAKVYGKTLREAVEDECFRQIDKSNSTQLWYFHQNLFKYVGKGWSVPTKGFDVVNDDLHIYVEMKNKHNTMNSSSSQKTYIKMQAKLLEDDEATCYLVEVISKKSCDEPWAIDLDGELCEHKKIRRMSIDKFYSLVFGINDAFYRLCVALPQIIEDVLEDSPRLALSNTVYDELISKHSDILTSLYLMAFSSYEGFNKIVSK